MILPARLTVLEMFRSGRDGRLHPITFSAEWMMRCSLLHHYCLWQTDFLQPPQEVHPLLGFNKLLFSLHLRSWVMVEPRNRKDSTLSTGELCKEMEEAGAGFFLSSPQPLHCLEGTEYQVILAAPGHQMVSLQSVGSLGPIIDRYDEGGVVRKLQEPDGLVDGVAAVGVHEKGRKNTALGESGAEGP